MHCPTLAELPPPPPGRTGWPWTEESPPLPDTMPDGSPWPLVGIVTPSFNQGQFVEETIRSVLLQGYPNLEYIIIDGGSTDESIGIIRKYEPWLAYWVSEKDRGQSHAINKGFERATAEVLAWLNSDDFYWPGAFGIAVQALHDNPSAGLVYTDCDYVDQATDTSTRIRVVDRSLAEMLRDGNCVTQQTAFFTKEALDRVGPLREDLHMIMDYDLWIRMKKFYDVVALSGVSLGVFRHHSTSKTVSAEYRQLPEFLRVFDAVYASPDLDPDVRAARRRSYGRIYLKYTMTEIQFIRAFPNGLLWYSKLVACCPQMAFPTKLFPLWLVKQAVVQTRSKLGGSFKRRFQRVPQVQVLSGVAKTEE